MKKATAFWLILAACLVLAGGAVFCLSMAVNHWDFSLLGNQKTETKTYEISEEFENITIRCDTEKIAFCPASDGSCRVVCQETKKEAHAVSAENGTLLIERTKSGKWYDNISLFSFEPSTITVYLPRAEYQALSIDTSTGDITISEGFRFARMDIDLSTGDVDCGASVSGPMRIQTDTGDIRLKGLSAGALDLTVTTGRVELQSVDCKGDIALSVSTGKAQFTDVSCRSFASEGSTGDLTLQRVIAAEKISVERSTGDVRFELCDAGELTVQTDTGKVTGSLLSAKVFITSSDTGRIEVPESLTGGKCKISTDTGDIQITITNE